MVPVIVGTARKVEEADGYDHKREQQWTTKRAEGGQDPRLRVDRTP